MLTYHDHPQASNMAIEEEDEDEYEKALSSSLLGRTEKVSQQPVRSS